MINIKKASAFKIILTGMMICASLIVGVFAGSLIYFSISGQQELMMDLSSIISSLLSDKTHGLLCLLISIPTLSGLLYATFAKTNMKAVNIETVKLTPAIEVPAASGQNQYGSARFSTEVEQDKFFKKVVIKDTDQIFSLLLSNGLADIEAIKEGVYREPERIDPNIVQKASLLPGIPISYSRVNQHKELIRIIHGNVHAICFGSTRCGKTRTLVLQSICLQALAGCDMLSTDPKGELYQYTLPFLTRLGYDVLVFDFKNPKHSMYYNFLQFIINALNDGDVSKAIQCTWDFVDGIVGEPVRGEPLWSNGEKALMAASVIQVVYDNSPLGLKKQYPFATDEEILELYEKEHKHYQNCCNVYNYLSQMTKVNPKTKQLLLEDIIDVLDDNHPSKMIMRIAESAPSKMRGSFITSALTTLRLFTDPNIAEITKKTSDGFISDKADGMHNKRAIFIILPDTKQTYYPLASIFTNQFYQYMSELADSLGGRLKRDFKFNLDEFGNFTKIPEFDTKLTVGAGRRIHFYLYVQAREQVTEKYGKEVSEIIFDNCHHWIYLKSGNNTAKAIEEKLGKYTVKAISSSDSISGHSSALMANSTSSSSSTQLMARSLLTHDEIVKIERPYILIVSDNGFPSLMQSPDLSKWSFNTMLGLGDEDFNSQVRLIRESIRDVHEVSRLCMWDFIPYINNMIDIKNSEVPIDNSFLEKVANNFEL